MNIGPDAPLGSLVISTGQPGRVDGWSARPGPAAAAHRQEGVGAAVGAPIIVDGTTWGYLGARVMAGETLPRDSENQLAEYTRLMAMAISNAQARDKLADLADEQAALRRVATLVAQGADPGAVFAAVVTEATRVLRVGLASLLRWDPGTRLATKVYGTHAEPIARSNGTVWTPEEGSLPDIVLRAGRPLRIDDWKAATYEAAESQITGEGFIQCISAPITVDGEQWGVLVAFAESASNLPPGAEVRLATFAQLMATAIANAQVRDDLRALAEQQGAALRRVATLVAQQAPPAVIFGAVAREASQALRVPRVDVVRCEDDGTLTPLGSTVPATAPGGQQHPARGYILVRGDRVARAVIATGRAARDDEAGASTVGAPINVEGAIWGVIIVAASEVLPADTETRLTDFTHLVASSISNVAARDKLIVSRARIVSASDETRRRIERNIHDGVQQRILAIALGLRVARARLPLPPQAEEGLDQVAGDLEAVLEEIRQFSRGLHPALLSRSGLGPSLRDLARRSPVPVDVDAHGIRRLPQPVETAVYYVVSEAIANAAKHSRADGVIVSDI